MGITIAGGLASRAKCFPARWNVAAKPCDYCKSTAALLFCRVHSAFMCTTCDSKLHKTQAQAPETKHERVWMCDVCEQAPSAVTCKADAAALCVTCDGDIHTANPLARRHERSPVVPFYDTAESIIGAVSGDNAADTLADQERKLDICMDQNMSSVTDSWMPTNPIIITTKLPAVKPMEFLFPDSDQSLDFDSYHVSSHPYNDSVVPAQVTDHSSENGFDFDFKRPNIKSYNNSHNSLSLSVSSSSMDMGVVPEGSSLSEISYPFARNMTSSVDISGNHGSPAVGMDREARVLRYREKKKNRKFEKTIRYASRKAYAETRPRIKGRFAKRTDAEPDIDRYFSSDSSNFVPDVRYGVVPWF